MGEARRQAVVFAVMRLNEGQRRRNPAKGEERQTAATFLLAVLLSLQGGVRRRVMALDRPDRFRQLISDRC